MKMEERNRMKDEDMKETVPLLISVFLFFCLKVIQSIYFTTPQYTPCPITSA